MHVKGTKIESKILRCKRQIFVRLVLYMYKSSLFQKTNDYIGIGQDMKCNNARNRDVNTILSQSSLHARTHSLPSGSFFRCYWRADNFRKVLGLHSCWLKRIGGFPGSICKHLRIQTRASKPNTRRSYLCLSLLLVPISIQSESVKLGMLHDITIHIEQIVTKSINNEINLN